MFCKDEVNLNKLERAFYEREDVVTIGKELLGKIDSWLLVLLIESLGH